MSKDPQKEDDEAPEQAAKKNGRPTKFSENLAQTIVALSAKGQTDSAIAKKLGIALSTLSLWKATRKDFSEAMSEAKDIASDLVVASLFQRAIGYQHDALKIFCTKGGKVVRAKYTEIYPPDHAAAMFWLKNCRPKEWRELVRQEFTGPDGGPIQTAQATKADVQAAALAALNSLSDGDEPKEDYE